MKVVTVVGARPQFVKAATVSLAFRKRERIEEILVHTGQHYDPEMSAIFFEQLGLAEPDYALEVGSGSHGQQTGIMLQRIEEVLIRERPDALLVYGDTNSTLAGALAAAKLHIPVAHVEAGLRSFNRHMPEEINRVMTDHVSDLLFAPTEQAVRNLEREGIDDAMIRAVGDVMLDSVRLMEGLLEPRSALLDELGLEIGSYALLTLHRAENTDKPASLRRLILELSELSARLPVVFPVHPRTRVALESNDLWPLCQNSLKCIKAVGYLDMLALERDARVVLTDSGGVQKEAFFWHKPCVTLRGETEWVELVELGWNRLFKAEQGERLTDVVTETLGRRRGKGAPYGDGRAAQRIAEEFEQWLGGFGAVVL